MLVKVKGLDVTSLKELGRLMGPLQRQAFRKVYEKILDLTAAEVFTKAVVSLAQYYDQPLRCFTFGDFQMVPTVEEFKEILRCPLGGRKPKIAAVVGDSAKELDRMKQTRNGVVGLPRKYLEGKARDMANQEKWVPFADILALLIFGVVLFPNVDGLVDLAAIDAFLAYHHSKESPVVAILADLFDTFDRRCEKNSARILGYPMRGAPTEESLSPFLVRDFGAQGLKVIQRVHQAWRSPLRKDKELRGIIGGYHGWLRVHTRGLDWLPKLKVINEENFEAPEEDEEVQALKLELGKARLAKEKFKSAATNIRKECTELREENAATTRALEQETKRARKEEHGRDKFRGALWGSNNELKLRRENLQVSGTLKRVAWGLDVGTRIVIKGIHNLKPSKKRKGSSSTATAAAHRRHGPSGAPTAPIPPSLSSPRSSTLFSSDDQRLRYLSQFSSRIILDPKYLDVEFFNDETFDCYQVFQNSGLVDFMSFKLPYYPELVKVFYCNLKIQDGIIMSEVHGTSMVIDQSLFFSLTHLPSQGAPFEGTIVDDWKFDYSSHDARRMVCNDQADMTGRLLAGSLTFDNRIMHYIIVRILLPRSSNLAQASEEDLILMWAFLTGRQIDWAHLVRYRMHKALRANAPLPYPHLITLFLRHFQIPLDDEPFVQVKRSFAIGAGAVTSFGYRKDRNGQWLKKDALPPQDERTPSPPPQREDSALMNEVLSELRGLRSYVGDRFDSNLQVSGTLKRVAWGLDVGTREELNQSVTHEQKLVEDFAQVYAEKEARGRVIDALHQEATMWMDRFALTLNGSQDLPRLLAKAKAITEVCTSPKEIHGLINYCQHMIDLMAHIIRNQGVQEQMKADLSALKDQMASIMKAMLKLQKTIEDNATTTASNAVREAEPVLQPAINLGRDRNTTVFGRRYSLQAYPYGLPPDFTPRAAPEELSQAPTFEGQLPPYADYPLQEDDEGDAHLGPLFPLKDPAPHELPQPNIVRHVPSSPAPFEYASNTAPNNNRRAPVVGARKKEGDTHAEMAPRKLASKRSRKDKAAEGTSSAPEYDSHRFRSAEHQQRFEAIKGWSFLWERRVQLRDDEYTDFQEEIVRRR
ncbi:hypothetical protein HKD37_10G027849 [Glycine soja]